MDCSTVIDEVIALSLEIYTFLLSEAVRFGPITVCCPGQSPAYIALAMKNLPIYDKNAVEILVLPYSKGGCSTINVEERISYGKALVLSGVVFRDNIYILDYVNSGAGINTFETMLNYNKLGRVIRKLAIIDPKYAPTSPMYKCFSAAYIHNLSDTFPRIVQHYPSEAFGKAPLISDFINVSDNENVSLVKMRAIQASAEVKYP
jgi:hypothetical protein